MTLAMSKGASGLSFLKELGVPLSAPGKISDQIYDAAAMAGGRSGRRLASERKAARSLQGSGGSFNLANYLDF